MIRRVKRLALTLIAKKYLAWAIAGLFLWYGKISGTDWCLLTAAIFAIDAYAKTQLQPQQETTKCQTCTTADSLGG